MSHERDLDSFPGLERNVKSLNRFMTEALRRVQGEGDVFNAKYEILIGLLASLVADEGFDRIPEHLRKYTGLAREYHRDCTGDRCVHKELEEGEPTTWELN